MTQHTPGPWKAIAAAVYAGRPLSTVVVSGDHGRLSADEAEANARLIAAAPELLEACKQMLAALDQLHREGLREYHPIADDTRAAIAKATQ